MSMHKLAESDLLSLERYSRERLEFRAASVKIGRPVVSKVEQAKADHYSSDCPMAGHQIESGLSSEESGAGPREPEHPMTLVRKAYGL